MSTTNTENTTETQGTAAEETQAQGKAPAKTESADGSEIKLTTEQLNERLERAKKAFLKETTGLSDAKAVAEKLKRLEALEKAKEEAERASLTEQERLKADAQAAEERAQKAIQERDAIAFESRISRICAELGVTNVEYAMWSIARAAEELDDDGKLDAKAHLQGLLKDSSSRAALGASGAGETKKTGATTTATTKADPKSGETESATKSAFDLDAKAWRAKRELLGI